MSSHILSKGHSLTESLCTQANTRIIAESTFYFKVIRDTLHYMVPPSGPTRATTKPGFPIYQKPAGT